MVSLTCCWDSLCWSSLAAQSHTSHCRVPMGSTEGLELNISKNSLETLEGQSLITLTWRPCAAGSCFKSLPRAGFAVVLGIDTDSHSVLDSLTALTLGPFHPLAPHSIHWNISDRKITLTYQNFLPTLVSLSIVSRIQLLNAPTRIHTPVVFAT